MTHSATLSFRLDTEVADDGDRAVLNVFQVLAINVVCSITMISVAMMYDVGWWMAVLVGWLGGSVATLVVAVVIVVLWPVESQKAALHAAHSIASASDTWSHMDIWHRDLAAERDAASRPVAAGRRARPRWNARAERLGHALFAMAAHDPAKRKAA